MLNQRTSWLAISTILLLVSVKPSVAQTAPAVDFSAQAGDFQLAAGNSCADIFVDANDLAVDKIVADDFAGDVQHVQGHLPKVFNAPDQLGANSVLIGTLGHSPVIDKLASDKKIDTTGVAGSWESFGVSVVDQPLPNVKKALVIFGSDRRGTAYGVFTVSQAIGVSPWVWWADVPPMHRDTIFIRSRRASDGPPSVKYRGIFINDEDFGMHPWASKTYDPQFGDIGPKTYAKVFELLLRLKANTLWPAMHPGSKEFNSNPENKVVADQYGIVMGSSHCEALLQNNVHWNAATQGPWSYVNNKAGLDAYWEERLKENGKYENMYTIGMRGIHDAAMPDGKTTEEKKQILTDVLADQRAMLTRIVNPDIKSIPQLFVPYKEVLTVYNAGLEVPDDVTLCWVDDNHGYIRRLSSSQEQKRPGGAGVYYHVSYWGDPHDYLWVCSTPPALIGEEMRKAYDYGAKTFWMLNVGDLKPAEMDIDLFMQLGWNINTWNYTDTHKWIEKWAGQQFGESNGSEIADILTEYYTLNDARKPEHMGWNTEYRPLQPSELSAVNYGDEQQERLDRYAAIAKKSQEVDDRLPPEYRDAFYELVKYPVDSSLDMNEKILDAQRSLLYAKQGRASAIDLAKAANDAYDAIQKSTDEYNNLAGGKWKYMMSDDPHPSRSPQPVFDKPKVAEMKVPAAGGLGVAVEGDGDALPTFDAYTATKHFVDVFDTGTAPISWTATAGAPWIILSSSEGKVDQRIWVSTDISKAPIGDAVAGRINITAGDQKKTVDVKLFNPSSPLPGEVKGFVESDGVVSMLAEHFNPIDKAGSVKWTVIDGLGRTGNAVTALPINGVEPANAELDYSMTIFHPGPATVYVYAIPTHHAYRESTLKYEVSIDDGPAQSVDLQADPDTPATKATWTQDVLRGAAIGKCSLAIDKPGQHVLKLRPIDPGLAFDKIVVDLGGLRPSYLGPPETMAK